MMRSFHKVSCCSRALRHLARPETLDNTGLPDLFVSRRLISSSCAKWQDPGTEPSVQARAPPPPSSTAPGPGTTNTTSTAPKSSAAAQASLSKSSGSKIPDLSTAQMQKQITSNLNRSRGSSITRSLAQTLRKTAKSTTESYFTYGLTEAFFKSCAAQAPYTIPEDQRSKILTEHGPPKTAAGEDLGVAEANTWWFQELGFQPTFSTWSQIALLHMYLLSVRLRAVEDRSAYTNYQRYLIEHFSNAAEDKMLLVHNINARGIRNKYLKDLFLQWRGLLAAYDEGIAKGDAVLAAALWRNLWKGDKDVDWDQVAAVVAYVRSAIQRLGQVELEDLVHNLDGGANVWSSARQDVKSITGTRSKGIDQAVTN